MAKKSRPLVKAQSRDQAVAIGMSKARKSGGDGSVVGYEVEQFKKGSPSPKGTKRIKKKKGK